MLLLFLVCLACLAVNPITHGSILRKRNVNQPCDTEECNKFARDLLNSMDQTVDPCTDFYEYCCGSWSKHHPIPPNEVAWFQFAVMREKTAELLRTVMEEPENPEDPESVKKTQRFYQSCMDKDARERNGISQLQSIVNSLGGWPIALPKNDWDPNKYPWHYIHDYYYKISLGAALVGIEYIPSDEDATKMTILIHHGNRYPFYVRDKNLDSLRSRSAYLDTIVQTVQIFAQGNANVPTDQILQDATDIIALETLLQNITMTDMLEFEGSTSFGETTIGELQQYYDADQDEFPRAQINWLEWITDVYKIVDDVEINSDTEIHVTCKSCIRALGFVINEFPIHVLVSYIHWVFISTHMQYTSQEMQDIIFHFVHADYDNTKFEHTPRWKQCIDELPLRDGMGYLFIEKYFTDDVINHAIDMTNNIRDELKRDVEGVEWASANMKKYMIDKLDHVKKEIGYPAWYRNKTAMKNLYSEFDVGSNYLENMINYNTADLQRQLKMLSTGFPEDEWLEYPVTVNAFYFAPTNTMLLPAAQMQKPYFVNGTPDAINYGFIGVIVGHELGHVLDNNGIQYDKDGNKFTDAHGISLSNYNKQTQCFIDQYSNYTLDYTDKEGNPIKLNGVQTLPENIADSLGVQVAYAAYKRKMQNDRNTPTTVKDLPSFTDDQLFFLSFGKEWCYNERKRKDFHGPYTDVHSPSNIRVIGALSNIEAFSQAFNCPSDSPLNRKEKCNLWRSN